jgi:poly(beta-D-mannuronate) lyase
VTDVTVAYNTYIDCKSPLQFGVGSNVAQKDVLPTSEIRSERPIRTVVANNLIYNSTGDKTPIVAHDKLDGIQFESNVIQNQGIQFDTLEGVRETSFELDEITESILIPTANFPEVKVFNGFGFEAFDEGIFGASRSDQNSIGAIVGSPLNVPNIFDTSQYGVDWELEDSNQKGKTNHLIKSTESLIKLIAVSNPGDVLQLSAGEYVITEPMKIDKPLVITQSSNEAEPATIIYNGPAGTPLFEMHPKGELTLQNITLRGKSSQHAFAPLKENMSSLYNLKLSKCSVENFDFILKAYKYSFSENIDLNGSNFINCKNGLELSEETEDKGEYNAENITISDCTFENIGANVIDYYRGGYDESTVGGNLMVNNSSFTNCGAKEKNKTLLNTYGIINVNLSGNRFTNNPVELVAQLWGAKNNRHSDNVLTNSGKILVEENLKLKTFY